MSLKIILIICALIILLVIPQVEKKIVYKKLTSNLGQGNYKQFEKILDGFWCTFSFRPFNREYMRLTSYMMQNDTTKIEEQFNKIFTKLKLNTEQKASVAQRAFYFYMEQKKYKKAKEMLLICKEAEIQEIQTMDLMFSILGEKKSEHIKDIKTQLESLKNAPNATTNNANIVRIGIYEYLLGLQYMYKDNKKESKKYLNSALQHCKGTPYEKEILALL